MRVGALLLLSMRGSSRYTFGIREDRRSLSTMRLRTSRHRNGDHALARRSRRPARRTTAIANQRTRRDADRPPATRSLTWLQLIVRGGGPAAAAYVSARRRYRSVAVGPGGAVALAGYRAVVAHVHHEWLNEFTQSIAADYERLHDEARRDPQRSGHGGEETWARLLREWLPPAYSVGTRKYIVPEEGEESFETDLVVFNPGYPERLRHRRDVLAGGVAAAFSVKLTLDAAGIRDGVERASALRRSTKVRFGSPRSELLGPFAVGLLAHSHEWTRPASTPEQNIADAVWELDHSEVTHPRESLDLLCVADLNTWTRMRAPFMPPTVASHNPVATPEQKAKGFCMTASMMSDRQNSPAPVAVFIAYLIERLSYSDPTLKAFADGLRLTDTWGAGAGPQRIWDLDDVFSEQVLPLLGSRSFAAGSVDWATAFLA
jgi:hypothetical protein